MMSNKNYVKRSLLVLAALCTLAAQTIAEEITISGSSTIRPIVEKVAKQFGAMHPDVKFIVGGGGSSHGVKSVATGEVMIGMASRYLKDKEMAKWGDLVPTQIASDGIAVIVNGKNPISAVSKQQIQDIYTGKITNWKDVGGNDAPVVLICKEEGRSTLELFLKYFGLEAKEVMSGKSMVMVHRKKGSESYGTTTAKMIGPNREAIASIVTKPNAIAYVSVGTAQEVANKGGRIKLLTLDGVEATIANVANRTYPLRRPLNVVTKGPATGISKEFINFLLSAKGQETVESLEFIALMD